MLTNQLLHLLHKPRYLVHILHTWQLPAVTFHAIVTFHAFTITAQRPDTSLKGGPHLLLQVSVVDRWHMLKVATQSSGRQSYVQ